MRRLIVSLAILLGYLITFGQESRREIYIRFPVSVSVLDTAYGDNATSLAEMISVLDSVKKDGTMELVEISLCGSASPEGPYSFNKELSNNRRRSLERYINRRISLPDSIVIRTEEVTAWKRLEKMVEDSDMPHKEEALNVLRNVPEFTYNDKGIPVDSRKKHLMELQYGNTWRYMHRQFFSQIRSACIIIVTIHQKPVADIQNETTIPEEKETTTEKETAFPAPADTTGNGEETVTAEKPITAENPAIGNETVTADETVTAENPVIGNDTVTADETDSVADISHNISKPFHMGLKTNMLYDALAIPNIGVEFYLGKNVSIGGGWKYGWWKNDNKHHYWRIYGGDIALRYWFGKKAKERPLTGHHIGVYGQVFTFDFEWGGRDYIGGEPGRTLWDDANWAAGVEYGYSLPVAKRLNIDFSLGIGYWNGKYYEYIPLDGHYVWQSTKIRHWFCPTKAEISLVWLLGNGYRNNKKEGGRQ